MPLYSYIPYLDPEIDDKEKLSFSGHIIDTDEEQERLRVENVTPKSSQRTTVDTFTRNVNENLRTFNNRITDLLQDGLGGVDNICRQVRDLLNNNNQVYAAKNMVNCARGDESNYYEEKRYNSQATGQSQEIPFSIKREEEEKHQEIYQNNNSVFAVQEKKVSKDDNLPAPSKGEKPRSRSTSRNLKSGKSDPKSDTTKLSSKSFDTTVRSFLNKKSSEKIKSSKSKSRKRAAETEPKQSGETCAKKRLGQIERDYQKVVENLGMVERMISCVNERIMSQKKLTKPLEVVSSKEKSVEQSKSKKKLSTTDKKQQPTENRKKSMVEIIAQKDLTTAVIKKDTANLEMKVEKVVKEATKPRRTVTKNVEQSEGYHKKQMLQEAEEKRIAEVIMKQMKSIERIKNSKSNKKLEESKKKTGQLEEVNPLSDIKINVSLSDIDALIDNAVMELGSLVSTEFDMSRSSSDASFKLTTEDGAQTLEEECQLGTSSSMSSGSANAMLGEDSDKFDISQSFQELKQSYVQKIKQEAICRKKEENKNIMEAHGKNNEEILMKNSYEQLHEKIFNDSTWTKLDRTSFECTLSTEPIKNSKSSIDLAANPQNNPVDQDSSKVVKSRQVITPKSRNSYNEQGDCTEDAVMNTIQRGYKEDHSEEIITISLPSTGQDIRSTKDHNTHQITVISKYDEEVHRYVTPDENNKQDISETNFSVYPNNFEMNQRAERTPTKQAKKKTKEKKVNRTSTKEKVRYPKLSQIEEQYYQAEEEAEDGIELAIYEKKSIEESSSKTKPKQCKANRERKPKKPINNSQFDPNDIKEIKKIESNFNESSSYSSFLSFEESMFWDKEEQTKEIKPIDPMRQVSIVCKKLISDLVVEEEPISLEEIMEGYFNTSLIQSMVCRPKRPRSVRIHTPIQDPDLRSIAPEVHRKKAISDLHERMEYQIRQTDSFDGFLNLMNKNRRKALIKQAERQDHNVRCQMRTCFRKKYPFRVVTASVPFGYDNKFKDKKEPEKKYINSLWFSPKDFKLRRNSRIFNRKRMEMYCQSLHKAPVIPKCKCGDAISKDSKKSEKASNYSILVRSGTPLGRRPNTPRRWIQLRPPTPAGGTSPRRRLHHCHILDDLTLKDLAPFQAEYPRNDDRKLPESLQGSLLYKLACGEQKGDADGTLMELITPRLTCTQASCKMCKCKSRMEKRPMKKIRSAKKSGDDSSVASTKTELQNLTPKAATQLLIQNIGEIKSKKSTTKSHDTKTKRSVKSLRKNSRKGLVQESKSTIQQRLEENMLKKIFQNNQVPVTEFSPGSTPLQRMAFKDIDHFQKILKVPELYSKQPGKKSNITKLFPYINDPDNKVFQNITVLPVKVFYNFESLKDSSEKQEAQVNQSPPLKVKPPINIACLSETDELEVSTIECRRPSTAEDKIIKRKTISRRRIGTPRSPTIGTRQSTNKFANLPPNPTGSPTSITYPIDVTVNRKSREIIGTTQDALNTLKISPRRSRFRRSSSLGKSTESDNPVNQLMVKRSGNPNPWKPASRRPRTPKTPPKLPTRIRSKEKSNLQQFPPCKTISTGWISPRQNSKFHHKAFEKCPSDSPRPEAKEQFQTHTLANKDKKMRYELNPSRNFYDIDHVTETKPLTTRAHIQKCRPLSPSQRMMVNHLHMLRNRNTRLQGNIQKAINIIEEKMVDVLSTNDQGYKKKTIDRMEKEINKVLKMINEQNCIMNKGKENSTETTHQDIQKAVSKTEHVKCNNNITCKQTSEEESQINAKAFITHTVGLKMPRPPRKRSISRVLKFHSRPSTVEEEKSYDLAEENNLFKINEGAVSDEEEAIDKTKDEAEDELGAKRKRKELYPSPILNDEVETSLCPVLRCPSPKTSFTKLSRKTKKILKKMSREAFGKFADVVRTKTRLIIDMTERIDMDDTNLLPNPKVTSALPAILARSTNLPVITTIHQPRPSDLMSTTVSSIVSVHQTPIERFLGPGALSGTTTEISEFANVSAERSITSFSESESYTWRKIQQSQPMELECSTCSLKRKISHDLTPFMRALNNLKAGRLFEKRHQLLPIEESSPSFGKMMNFLERLSKVKESMNQTTTRDVQLMWNPEKRCSFHNSIAGTKRIKFRRNTKAISEHSMIQYPATSISELFSEVKIEENPSEAIGDTNKESEQQQDDKEEKQQMATEKTEGAETNVNSNELEVQQKEKPGCKLVFSEVQLISVCSSRNFIKKQKKRPIVCLDHKKSIPTLKDDRYSNILKLFYFIFYTLVYFCMTAMNFSC